MTQGLFGNAVPTSWLLCELGELVEEGSDSAIPSESPHLPFVGMEHVESISGRILAFGSASDYRSSSYIARPTHVLYGRLRPYLNKVFIPDRQVYASREFIVLTPGKSLKSPYLLHLLRSAQFVNYAMSLNSGDRPRVKWQQIGSCLIPVPSPLEQTEIVRILEEQFSRLDAAAAAIAAVRRKANQFRCSLLHAAFTGALTHTGARRMSDNQSLELPEAWVERSIGEVASFGRKPSTTLLEGNVEVSFVPMTCVEEESGRIELGQVISATEGKRRSLTYFEDGDVLFAKITPCMENGKVAVAKGLQNGAAFGSSEFYVLRPKEDTVLPEFLNFVLVDPSFRSKAARAMTGAVGQQRVPRRFIEAFNLDIPPLPEQREIVRILEEQFFRLEGSLAVADEVEQKVGALRQSLLHAAFSGELTKEWRERDRG